MNYNLRPTSTKILVSQKRIKETTNAGIVLVQEAREVDKFYNVLAIGPDVMCCKKGDVVYADISAGSLIEDTKDEIIGIIDEEDVLAIKEEK